MLKIKGSIKETGKQYFAFCMVGGGGGCVCILFLYNMKTNITMLC